VKLSRRFQTGDERKNREKGDRGGQTWRGEDRGGERDGKNVDLWQLKKPPSSRIAPVRLEKLV